MEGDHYRKWRQCKRTTILTQTAYQVKNGNGIRETTWKWRNNSKTANAICCEKIIHHSRKPHNNKRTPSNDSYGKREIGKHCDETVCADCIIFIPLQYRVANR
jgi:hypothetical protein